MCSCVPDTVSIYDNNRHSRETPTINQKTENTQNTQTRKNTNNKTHATKCQHKNSHQNSNEISTQNDLENDIENGIEIGIECSNEITIDSEICNEAQHKPKKKLVNKSITKSLNTPKNTLNSEITKINTGTSYHPIKTNTLPAKQVIETGNRELSSGWTSLSSCETSSGHVHRQFIENSSSSGQDIINFTFNPSDNPGIALDNGCLIPHEYNKQDEQQHATDAAALQEYSALCTSDNTEGNKETKHYSEIRENGGGKISEKMGK